MAEIYIPENVPEKYDSIWLQKELQRIADLLNEPELPLITYSIVHVEPSKKREGMVVNADGIDWNPGYGAGLYIYLNSEWNKINNNHVSITALATATQYAKLCTYSFPTTNNVSAKSTLLLTPIGDSTHYPPILIEVIAKQGTSGLDTTNAQINVIRNSKEAVLYDDFDLVTATAANGTDIMLWMRSVVAAKYAIQVIAEETDTGVSSAYNDGATWTATNPVTGAAASVTSGLAGRVSALFHAQEQQPSGTNSGTFTSGAWRTRVLNTVVANEIAGASLASNQITLPAGTYFIDATAQALAVDRHKAKLYDTTGTVDLIIGLSEYASNPNYQGDKAKIYGRFTLSVESVLEIQHRCQTTRGTNGFGVASSFGVIEIYADVKIYKIS